MNLQIKYNQDKDGVKYAPITVPQAVRWSNGDDLDDKLSEKEDKTSIESVATGSVALSANVSKYYTFVDAIETFDITLPSPTDATKVQTIVFFMTIGTTPAITFSSALPIYYHDGFELEAGKTYEVNALFNGSAWIIASVEIVIPTNEGE